MKTRSLMTVLSALLLIPMLAFADGGEKHDMDATVGNAVAHFAAIGTSLSTDSVEGVPMHANGILAIMDAHMAEGSGHHEKMKMHAEGGDHGDMKDMKDMKGMDHEGHDMKAMHESMRAALATLADEGTDLDGARDAYKALGENFIPMAQKMYKRSELDPKWAVMNCPMVKAEWIQVDGKVANPFYGTKMVSCGEKVGDLAATDGGGHDMKGMKMDDTEKGEHGEHHGG